MKKKLPKFHPRAPIKLKRLWKQYLSYHRLAKYLDVNPAVVWNALKKGKEPVNLDVRIKFGLPRKPRKPRAPRAISLVKCRDAPRRFPTSLWWRQELGKVERDRFILEAYSVLAQSRKRYTNRY